MQSNEGHEVEFKRNRKHDLTTTDDDTTIRTLPWGYPPACLVYCTSGKFPYLNHTTT